MKKSSQIQKIFRRLNKSIGHEKEKRVTDKFQVPGSAQTVPFAEIESEVKKQIQKGGNEFNARNIQMKLKR